MTERSIVLKDGRVAHIVAVGQASGGGFTKGAGDLSQRCTMTIDSDTFEVWLPDDWATLTDEQLRPLVER